MFGFLELSGRHSMTGTYGCQLHIWTLPAFPYSSLGNGQAWGADGRGWVSGHRGSFYGKPTPKKLFSIGKTFPHNKVLYLDAASHAPEWLFSRVLIFPFCSGGRQSTKMTEQCTGESEIKKENRTQTPSRQDVSIYHKHGAKQTSLLPQKSGCPTFLIQLSGVTLACQEHSAPQEVSQCVLRVGAAVLSPV